MIHIKKYFIYLMFILLIAFSMTAVLGGTSAALEEYQFILKWGTYGSGDGQFNYPYGVGVDSSGNVYVADSHNHRIQKFGPDGAFITKWGTYGTGDGQFYYPSGVAVDSSGNVYVADFGNHRIQKFRPDGAFITKWGGRGLLDGQLNHPFGVAVDSSGNVYIADTGNNRIQKFRPDGAFITKWGTYYSQLDGQFKYPYGVAVDSSGNVHVVDQGNHRIQKFNSSGTFITKWGSYGIGDGQFSYPHGVAVDSSGNVYVTDFFNRRVQKFRPDGAFITKWGTSGQLDGQFRLLYGVAVDSSGNVYIADSGNCRIQKFGLKSSDITPPVITPPADIIVDATGPDGAIVTYSAAVTDDMDPNPTVVYSPASGSLFPVGTTTVTITATDAAGNSSTATFTVTVISPKELISQGNKVLEGLPSTGVNRLDNEIKSAGDFLTRALTPDYWKSNTELYRETGIRFFNNLFPAINSLLLIKNDPEMPREVVTQLESVLIKITDASKSLAEGVIKEAKEKGLLETDSVMVKALGYMEEAKQLTDENKLDMAIIKYKLAWNTITDWLRKMRL